MGLFSDARERGDAAKDVAAEVIAGCPDPPNHYATEVNKGSISVTLLQGNLALRFQRGYRLAHAFEQNGNTVLIYEHAHKIG